MGAPEAALPEPAYHPARILVQPRPEGARGGLIPLRSRGVQHRVRLRGLMADADGPHVMDLPPGIIVPEAIDQLRRSGQVLYAEPDHRIQAARTPDDPFYTSKQQWGLNQTGLPAGTPDADIDAPEGWDHMTGAESVVVAVIDSGISQQHEDLALNLWVNRLEIPGNGLDDDRNGYADDVHGINAIAGTGNPEDDYGHGTHVAGILGAVGNNGLGIAGVAWRVQIMAVKFLDDQGLGYISDAIRCLDYARRHGARIVNASWTDSEYSESLDSAIARLSRDGILFVTVAGNQSLNLDRISLYPASYEWPNILVVTGVNRYGALASGAGYGASSVDLGAPGEGIYSTYTGGPSAYTPISGTSMAAPFVSGILALLRERYPMAPPDELRHRLLATAKPLSALSGKSVSGGVASLSRALSQELLADFEADRWIGAAPLSVRFANASLGEAAAHAWDFGDGSAPSAGPDAQHTFDQEGEFKVALTVTGASGLTSRRELPVQAVANYRIEPVPFRWVDPATLDPVADASKLDAVEKALPFDGAFYGKGHDRIWIIARGALAFQPDGLGQRPLPAVPDPDPPSGFIAPAWSDWEAMAPDAVRCGIQGQAPYRRWIVSWTDMHPWGMPELALQFQASIEETSGRIEFHYGPAPEAGEWPGAGGAVMGIEHESGHVGGTLPPAQGWPGGSDGAGWSWIPTTNRRLLVGPAAGLHFAGPAGGPFVPEKASMRIHNVSTQEVFWQIHSAQEWIGWSATNGILAAGASVELTLAIRTNAYDYLVGDYAETIRVSEGAGAGWSDPREVSMQVRFEEQPRLRCGPGADPFRLRVSGTPARWIGLESATDWSGWRMVETRQMPAEGHWDWTETLEPDAPARFYRARQVDPPPAR